MSTAFLPDSAHLIALESVVRRLELHEQRTRAMEAERVRLLAEAFDVAAAESDAEPCETSTPCGPGGEIAYRAVRAELATALHLSETSLDRQLAHAHALSAQYPTVLRSLDEGEISGEHARAIVDAGLVIGCGRDVDTASRRHSYSAAVLEIAASETPNRLRPIARRLAEQFAEATIDERHAEARERRRVFVVERHDGMSDLVAHLPSVQARAIYDRLTGMGKRLAETEEGAPESMVGIDPRRRRTRDQLRADLLGDMLLGAAPESVARQALGIEAVQAQLQVIVTDEALFAGRLRLAEGAALALGEQLFEPFALGAPSALMPAEVDGCGPISTDTARLLAASAASWQLVHQDPSSGAVLSVARYRPNEAMRRHLAARDEHCRFPGCRAPAHRCDIDHTFDAVKGGATSTDNLAHLCRGHHTLKHHGGWSVQQRDDGELAWRSPTGRAHRDRPPSRVRFVTRVRC